MSLVRMGRIIVIGLRNFRRERLQAVLAILAATVGTGGVVVSTDYAAARTEEDLRSVPPHGHSCRYRHTGGEPRSRRPCANWRPRDHAAKSRLSRSHRASSRDRRFIADYLHRVRVRSGDLTKSTTIVGCAPAYFAVRDWSTQSGDLFDAGDDRGQRRVALLGATLARDLFGESDPIGRRINIGREPFEVAGVLRERGQGLDAANEDAQVYVPLATGTRRLMNADYYTSIVVEIGSWQSMDRAAREIAEVMSRRHRPHSFTGPDFQVQNQKALVETQLAAFSRLTFFLRWIAASTAVVASLGIFAIAWIGVGHRSPEIGARRAIGATIADIVGQFFVEGIAGPILGCAAGVAVSWPVLRLIDLRVQQPFLFSGRLAIESAAVSVLLHSGSCLACCWRALGIDPSAALRAE